jgi:hypothetical protein
MRVYTDIQAKQQFTDLLAFAENEEVMIKRQDGVVFFLAAKKTVSSPFDVEGINANVSTQEIINAVRESREM